MSAYDFDDECFCHVFEDGYLMTAGISFRGNTLDDCLDNAVVSIENWHGQDLSPRKLYDLPNYIVDLGEQRICEKIQEQLIARGKS